MGRRRSWSDEQLVQAVSVARSWRGVFRELGIPASSTAIGRLKGHALRLGLDVTHLGGPPAVAPLASPQPLDNAAVISAVASSLNWTEALRKLDLPVQNRNYKRIQAIANDAGVTVQAPPRAVAVEGYIPPATPIPPPPTVRKGVRSEGAIMNALIAAGYNVLIPFGVARYDLVIETVDGFSRVQCKTGRLTASGCMTFNLSSRSPEGVQRGYKGEVDYFGVFLPSTGDAYLIPMNEVDGCRNNANFRLSSPADGRSGAHYAAPYRLVAQQDRALVS
jgi:PD-(D/E)XK endonuclease